jgi:GNAT superfamily N-acetyltransferase
VANVEKVGEEDWARVARVRLEALGQAPEAFGSSLSRELGFGEQHWRLRLRGTPTWLARDGDDDVGILSAIREPGAPEDERHLVSLWVRPDARRRGAGRALLGAAERWAVADGARRLTSWVVAGNDEGAAVHRASGFAPTGATTPLPRDPVRVEEQWAKALTDPADDRRHR